MTEQNALTHDEIIDILKGLVFCTFDKTTVTEREALNDIIKSLEQESIGVEAVKLKESYNTGYADGQRALTEYIELFQEKQESCEDCVSREELKKWLDMNFSFGGTERKLELFDRLDKELPSVKPKESNTSTFDKIRAEIIEEKDCAYCAVSDQPTDCETCWLYEDGQCPLYKKMIDRK